MSTTTALANVRTRQEWAEIINNDWRKSVLGIVQTGRDIIAAKDELPPSEFSQMVENDLLFSRVTAENLMRVARHPEIANCSSTNILPPSWAVLNELSRLTPEDFRDAVAKDLITPKTSLRQARSVSEAYLKPEGVVGGRRSPSALPSPSEARKIARETGRFVAASDNNIYSGATVEEGAEYRDRRTVAFRIIEAIGTLAEAPETFAWLRTAEQHWFVDFRPGAIDDAREWLGNLKEAMEIVDA